jgi:guanylate kinase
MSFDIVIKTHIVKQLLTVSASRGTEQIEDIAKRGEPADAAIYKERQIQIIVGCTDVIKVIKQEEKILNEPENIKTILGAVIATATGQNMALEN